MGYGINSTYNGTLNTKNGKSILQLALGNMGVAGGGTKIF